ncbi:hypothetical protein JOC70_003256 [Clostridium pascui]|uniref:hypothetical protein n=1 Tax=Clostridium pascui TaxID=46609 RepID=UPI00195C9FF3|nr:hypothetical protein [Clostridium pascui]MBM7871746.1 hypothetical protein [Clostridium pascui]
MSKKHRHRRRCEEELELMPRNNMFPQNSPQGVEDSSLAFIGLLEMLGSQFNLFGNNNQSNNEDLSSNVQTEDENNEFNVYEEEQEVLNTEVDDNIEHNIENIVEDVEYEVKENIVEDIADNNVADIYNIEDTEDKYNTDNINSTENIEEIDNNLDETSDINDIELTENQVTVHCKAKVSNNTVLECCSSKNIKSKFIKEPVVCKLPVIISQIEIPICIETLTKFNEPAFKIIDVNKEVFLESCNLINNSNKLFIKGFIRENITYSNINCVTEHAVSGNVKSLEVDISFKCSTKVYFNNPPVLNNKICCKLCSTNILGTMSQEGIKVLKNKLPETYTFREVTQKIILNLGLSLLQEQYVFIDK